MHTYTELQRMPGRWLTLAFFVAILAYVGFLSWSVSHTGLEIKSLSLVDKPHKTQPIQWVGDTVVHLFQLFFVFLTLVLIYNFAFCQIDLRIDSEGIHYQLFPLNKGKTIPWSEVARTSVREFVLYGEYPQGKGMFRQGPNGWAHSFSRGNEDNYGLQIEKKSGVNILIGTRQPDQLRQFLADIHPAVQA